MSAVTALPTTLFFIAQAKRSIRVVADNLFILRRLIGKRQKHALVSYAIYQCQSANVQQGWQNKRFYRGYGITAPSLLLFAAGRFCAAGISWSGGGIYGF